MAVAAMLALSLTACNNDNGTGSEATTTAGAEVTTTASEETTPAVSDDGETTSEDESDGGNADEASETQKILNNIREAYGDNYLPSMSIDNDTYESMFGISADLYSEAAGDMMMISTYPDTVMIFKAADGKFDDLLAAVNAYKDTVMANTMQYPINIEKVNATKVVTKDDYVAFLLVGAIDESDEPSPEFAQEQVQIAVDAFNASF